MGKSNRDLAGDFLGTSKTAKLAKKYGVAGVHFGHPDGRSGRPNRMPEQVEREVAAKMANDYDVRRSLEAASLAGNKKAKKIGSINNIESALAAEKFMKKTHKNRMGNGGAYDGANDEGGVTDYWVNKDRNKLINSLTSSNQAEPDSNKNASPNDNIRKNAPISTELSEARARVAQHEEDIYSGTYSSNLFDKNYDPAGANSFLERYKLKLNKQRQRYQ